MAKASKPIAKSKGQPEMFKGGSESLSSWVNLSVVQRWADERMPVSKQGRFVTSSPEQLNVWLGREPGKPVHVITPEADLPSELKRGFAFFRATKKCSAKRSPALRTRDADVSFFAPNTWH